MDIGFNFLIMQQNKKIPTIDLRVPASWEELTDNQLRYLFGLIALDLSLVEIRTHCLLHWSGLKVLYKYGTGWWCKFVDDEFLITAEQVNAAIGALKWIGTPPPRPVRISRIGKHHALPADFQEVPFETYLICDNLYQGYLTTRDKVLLQQMGYHLYSSEEIELTDAERIGVFYWFASLKTTLAHEFSHLFIPEGICTDDRNLFERSANKYKMRKEEVNAQIRALTKGDVTKEKEVLAIDTWRALTELDALAQEYRNLSRTPLKK